MSFRKPARSAGIGDSALNIAEPDAFPLERDIRDCHMNGILIGTLYDTFTPEQRTLLVYANTDEAREERAAALVAAGRLDTGPKVEVVRSEWDGQVLSYADKLGRRGEAPTELWQDLFDKHVENGFAGKMLSKAVMARKGLRGYTIVTDKHGAPIEQGNMVLGKIPREVRDWRKREARRLDHEQQQAPEKEFRENEEMNFRQERVLSAVARKARAEGAGLQEDSPYE